MRSIGAGLIVLLAVLAAQPAWAARPNGQFSSHEQIRQWLNDYRLEPQPKKLPAPVKAVGRLWRFRAQAAAGVNRGFMAGVRGRRPSRAGQLNAGVLPVRPED